MGLYTPFANAGKNRLVVRVGDDLPKISMRLRDSKGAVVDIEGDSLVCRWINQSTGAQFVNRGANNDQKGNGFNRITAVSSTRTVSITTESSHSLSAGDRVWINGLNGAGELNGKSFVVTNASGTTFDLEDVDGDHVSSRVSGGVVDTRGLVSFDIEPADVASAGVYWVRVIRTTTGGEVQTYPVEDTFELEVLA